MVKTVWLSSLGSSEETVKNLVSQLRTYGLIIGVKSFDLTN